MFYALDINHTSNTQQAHNSLDWMESIRSSTCCGKAIAIVWWWFVVVEEDHKAL